HENVETPDGGHRPPLQGDQRGKLLQRDVALIPREPLLKGLKCRIQASCDGKLSRTSEVLFEITLKLEHISEVFGARETKAAVDLWRNDVVTHFLAQRFTERSGHLRPGQVLAGDADG